MHGHESMACGSKQAVGVNNDENFSIIGTQLLGEMTVGVLVTFSPLTLGHLLHIPAFMILPLSKPLITLNLIDSQRIQFPIGPSSQIHCTCLDEFNALSATDNYYHRCKAYE